MGDCKKFIADFPVDSAEFFTAITYATSELYISMHVLDLENNTAFPIKTNEFIDKFMKCGSTLQESITNIMVNLAKSYIYRCSGKIWHNRKHETTRNSSLPALNRYTTTRIQDRES